MRAMISTLAVAFALALAAPALSVESKKDAGDTAKDATKKEMSVQQPPAKPGETVETTGKLEEGEKEGKAMEAGKDARR